MHDLCVRVHASVCYNSVDSSVQCECVEVRVTCVSVCKHVFVCVHWCGPQRVHVCVCVCTHVGVWAIAGFAWLSSHLSQAVTSHSRFPRKVWRAAHLLQEERPGTRKVMLGAQLGGASYG